MERYNGSDCGNTERYLIQGTESNPYLITPPLEQIEAMDNEGAPEFIVDQGLYYPSATNYYGYYCTGFESPGEWDDHHKFFGLDGTDLHYTGLQTESLPYVYYTPSYAFAQSPYNPYNPYIPGAIVGVDGPFVGTQQYYTTPYQQSVSSPAYYPIVMQPGQDIIPNNLTGHSLITDGSNATRPGGSGLKHNTPSASMGSTMAPSRPTSVDLRANSADTALNQTHSFAKVSEGSKVNVAPSKQLATHESISSGSAPHSASLHVNQGKNVSGSIQAADHFSLGRVPSLSNTLKVTRPVSSSLSDFGSNARGWVVVDKVRQRLHYGGVLDNGNGSPDVLGEQNRGPRTNRSKNQLASSISVKAYTTKAGASNAQGNIIIYADQYNKEDFPANYFDAKFFVIKSYSEDDVHKSIKYNVWSSTPNGNKRLDSAFEDAQRVAAGKPRGCPIFLFFSVNASGQFCGVAEMIGPVDFHKDMDFWQQDKWSGSFPVKWHIIKDVPNTNFRHIILENNENKPVTNSRDTQEIKHKQGIEMLIIFKNYTLKTSILDDFMYYEERQKIMQEEKSRLLGKSFESSFFVPAFVPPNKSNGMVIVPPKADEKTTKHNDPDSSGKKVVLTNEQFPPKADATNSSSAKDNAKHNLVEDANNVTSVLKIGSLTINPKQAESNALVAATVTPMDPTRIDVVTVGSMPVKVNGYTESSSGMLTVGTISIDPKARKP